MASVYETGHAKNVANFNTLVSFVTAYGATYNPSKAAIKLTALQTTAATAETVMAQVSTLLATNANAVAARNVAFTPLKKLSTRLLNALKATDASTVIIANMATLNRKIQGQRASKKLTDAIAPITTPTTNLGPGQDPDQPTTSPQTPTQISAAQLSFDSLLATFDKQVKLLASITVYAPNERELSVASLQDLYSDLKAQNAAVVNTATQISNARLARNQTMYHPETGMKATALDVKSYVKSVFGASSAQYKQISALAFKSVEV